MQNVCGKKGLTAGFLTPKKQPCNIG